jgi:hypothetical protein
MVNQHEYETRLAELVWRTVKLRVSLLILSILALLVVWSALINGNQEAQKVDHKFCVFLENHRNEIQKSLTDTLNRLNPGNNKLQPFIQDPENTCSGGVSRTDIESIRYADETTPLDALPGHLPDDVVGILKEDRKAFGDYDIQRRGAYRLQLHLSSEYSGGSVEVNALSVAEIFQAAL